MFNQPQVRLYSICNASTTFLSFALLILLWLLLLTDNSRSQQVSGYDPETGRKQCAHLLRMPDVYPGCIRRHKEEWEKQIAANSNAIEIAKKLSDIPSETIRKLCILSAAELLPKVPNIQIKETKIGKTSIVETLTDVLMHSRSLEATANQFDRNLNFINDRILQRIRNMGWDSEVKLEVRNAILEAASGAADIELAINAAGVDAKFGYLCVWKNGVGASVHPIGIRQ